MAFDPDLPAIRTVLAAYRSTEAHITEEQVTAAWQEYAVVSAEHPTLVRRRKWPPEHLVLAARFARRLVADGIVPEGQSHDAEQSIAAEYEAVGEETRRTHAKAYVAEMRRRLEGGADAA